MGPGPLCAHRHAGGDGPGLQAEVTGTGLWCWGCSAGSHSFGFSSSLLLRLVLHRSHSDGPTRLAPKPEGEALGAALGAPWVWGAGRSEHRRKAVFRGNQTPRKRGVVHSEPCARVRFSTHSAHGGNRAFPRQSRASAGERSHTRPVRIRGCVSSSEGGFSLPCFTFSVTRQGRGTLVTTQRGVTRTMTRTCAAPRSASGVPASSLAPHPGASLAKGERDTE